MMTEGDAKRARRPVPVTEPGDSLAIARVFDMPFIFHKHIVPHFYHNWRDHWALALVTARFWRYYCENDESVRWWRNVFCAQNVRRLQWQTLRRMILDSGLPTCYDRLWYTDVRKRRVAVVAEEYVQAGAFAGSDFIVQRYGRVVDPESATVAPGLMHSLCRGGHDAQALKFASKTADDKVMPILTLLLPYAHRVPRTYGALMARAMEQDMFEGTAGGVDAVVYSLMCACNTNVTDTAAVQFLLQQAPRDWTTKCYMGHFLHEIHAHLMGFGEKHDQFTSNLLLHAVVVARQLCRPFSEFSTDGRTQTLRFSAAELCDAQRVSLTVTLTWNDPTPVGEANVHVSSSTGETHVETDVVVPRGFCC